MFLSRAAATIVLVSTLGFAPTASADLILGQFLGPGSGDNDSVAAILTDFGLGVMFLARIEPPEGANPVSGTVVDGLTYFDFFLNDDSEPAGGTWSYDGSLGTAHLLAVKAGPNWGVWLFTDALTNNMPNMGLFDTLQLQPGNDPGDQRGFGDVTVYEVVSGLPVPEPSAIFLACSGLVGLGALGRRRTA